MFSRRRGKPEDFDKPKEELAEKPVKSRRAEKKEDEYEWDKKRILIVGFSVIVVLALAVELKRMFLPNTSILGDSTVKKASEVEKPKVKPPSVDLQSKVGASLADIKNNIANLDPEEVASSSPQIQKVLQDMQGIKDLPKDEAKNACMRICSGI
jgi:hypothetical protein